MRSEATTKHNLTLYFDIGGELILSNKCKVRTIELNGIYTIYTISTDGIVMNKLTNREVPQFNCTSGRYKAVHLRINGKDYKRMVHRLVAQAFIPNPENKPQVNHIDNNPKNNNVTNLEWVTCLENIHHMIKSGNQVVGVNHKNAKYTEQQIHQVCKLLEDLTYPLAYISKKTGVGIKTIKNIRSGKGWPHIAKNYNIDRSARPKGPSFSNESKKIMEFVRTGFTDADILRKLGLSGTSSRKRLKSVKAKIYHIRKKYFSSRTFNDCRPTRS